MIGMFQSVIKKIVLPGLQLQQRGGAIVGLLGVATAQIAQQVADDPAHRREIIHDQSLHAFVHPQPCSSVCVA